MKKTVFYGFPAITFSLGVWQLARLRQKEAYLKQLEDAAMNTQDVDKVLNEMEKGEKTVGKVVYATGKVLGNDIWIGPRTKDGQRGYSLVNALQLDYGPSILIDRGWVLEHLRPHIKRKPISVRGLVVDSQPSLGNDIEKGRFYARDIPLFADLLGTKRFMIQAIGEHSGNYEDPVPRETVIEGIPNNHLGYAMIWFSSSFLSLLLIRKVK